MAPFAPPFAIAVSGGPDSLALLLLAAAAFPGAIEAATVDHGLRPEAGGEAAFVANLCAERGIPHSTLTVNVPSGGDGLQGEARRARYAALSGWAEARGLRTLLTAHHADDQAETLLMRLQRGSGLSGLSAIRAVRPLSPKVTLCRPLLGWSRDELADIVRDAGIAAVDDPSNRNTRFDRVRVRQFLRDYPDFDPLAFARTAAALTESEEALDWAADRLWSERSAQSGPGLSLDSTDLPAELMRRLLLKALEAVVPGSPPRGGDVHRLMAGLKEGKSATLAGVKCSVEDGRWHFVPEPPRRRP